MSKKRRPEEIVDSEELARLLPFLHELDAARWHLIGYDTYSREFYRLYQEFASEKETQLAAVKYLLELEKTQPSETSGGQEDDGIQDRAFILGPGNVFYRLVF